MLRRWFQFLPLLFLLVLCGCIRPYPQQTERVLPLRSEAQLLRQLDTILNRYQSLQSSVRLEVEKGKERFTANQLLFAERPAQFRSEVLYGPFATPVLSLSVDQGTLSVYQPLKGIFSEGSASVANISKFTQLPLRIEDLVGMILVSPPLYPFEEVRILRVVGADRLDLLTSGGVEQHFAFDEAGHLLQSSYFLGGKLQLQANYSGFDETLNDFPRQLQVQMPEREVLARLSFSETQVNLPIPAKNFKLTVPVGAKLQPLP